MTTTPTLLIVDDESMIRLNLRALFEDAGYRVTEAANGREGLEVFAHEHPDLVLTDLRMPVMDGQAFICELKQRSPDTPVIIVSGKGTMLDAIQAVRHGAWDYVAQPIEDANHLELTVKRALEHAQLQAENRAHREHLEDLIQKRTRQLQESEESLRRMNAELEQRVIERTADLSKLSQAIVDSPVSVMITDREGRIEYVNPKFSELTGYSAGEVLGRTPRILKSGQHSAEFYEHLWQTISAGRQWHGEFCNRRKTGELCWESGSIAPIRNAAGEITHYVAVKEDITEGKRLAVELQTAKQAAEAANRAKSVFLAHMSHEIRTPLNAILGFSQLMLHDVALTPGQRQRLNAINRSGEHLLALINDVLEMSKIEAGHATLHPAPFDLPALLRDLEMLFRPRAEAKQLLWAVERLGPVPQAVIGDESKLRQVLINLLGNAVKFTEHGGIVLRVRVQREDSGGLRFTAEVRDTGPGIAPPEMTRLFGQFEQTEAGYRARTGTGLGLAISRQYARLMGGEITVSSQVGEGSMFRLEVLLNEGEAAPVDYETPWLRVPRLPAGQPRPRVLVADDDDDSRMVLAQTLDMVGFEVCQVANGEEAVQAFQAWQPHLVVLDLRMPVMDGITVTRHIRAAVQGRTTPILVVSASAFEEERQKVLDCGADDFIRKPYREPDLLDKVAAHLKLTYVDAADAEVGWVSDPTRSTLSHANSPHGADAGPGTAQQPTLAALARASVATLPAPLVERMRQAATKADFDLLLELIGEAGAEPAPRR
jgi:PAS domain S-box-containing protein